MIAPARQAAYAALRAITSGRMDLPAALAASRARLADPRDTALAADIVTGTLRQRAALDHVVAHAAGRPPDRLDPEVLDILRLSAYQLVHLDRVPARAVVDDAVELTKKAGKRSASGLVNAVLRALLRSIDHLPLPARPALAHDRPMPGTPEHEAALEYLSITRSHPRWLAARWLDRHGFAAADAWTAFDNEPAPMTLRVNTLKTTPDALTAELAAAGVQVRPARYAPDALVIEQGHPLKTAAAARGLFLIQDEASQLVGLFTGAAPGERVLDACAAPGGKTAVMAALMHDAGFLVAADRRWRRMALLKATLETAGVRSARLVALDMLQPPPFQPAAFDRVLLDAPCSGLGTIRRDPDIRWRRAEADVAALSARQIVMLRRAADGVRPGGSLIYATCSSEPDENDAVVDGFLALDPRFEIDGEPARGGLPSACDSLIDGRGFLRTSPPAHGLEAFFAARLRRRL